MSWLKRVFGQFDPRVPEFRRRLFLVVAGLVFLLAIGVSLILVWDYTNSPEFCGTRCHTMPPEWIAYSNSLHAETSCVDCHIGRVGTLRAIQLKSTHGGHLTSLIFNDFERPIFAKSLRPARETCERCHWPEAAYDDSVRKILHYAQDENNTLRTTFLIMKTGGGTERFGTGRGIHWHIVNEVYYIATDKQKTEIPWIQVVDAQGNTTEYVDVEATLTQAEIDAAEKDVVDCLTCHNRAAHLFTSPESAVDKAMSLGRIDKSIPYIKKKAMELVGAVEVGYEQGLAAIDGLSSYYQTEYPEFYAQNSGMVEQAEVVIREIYENTYFPNMSVGWSTYQSHDGHKDFAGCFRCHDGQHLNPEGDSVRLHCNICHSIPVVYSEDAEPKIAELGSLLVSATEPPSHLAANFIADHRFQADQSCEECHGPLDFGSDDDSFCSNSACHGTKWPVVDLDAAFPHPIPLEGKHAEAWCHDCHVGVKKPEYVCANCHQPPRGHPDGDCAQCHTPEGFKESAAAIVGQAAAPIPHQVQGREQCLTCHESMVKPVPDSHEGRANDTCTACHKA